MIIGFYQNKYIYVGYGSTPRIGGARATQDAQAETSLRGSPTQTRL